MELFLKRVKTTPNYIIGCLYINNEKFCNTIESYDKLSEGFYEVKLLSNNKFDIKGWAHYGKVPTIMKNNESTDTVIFIGTSARNGVITVGNYRRGNIILDSKLIFEQLMFRLSKSLDKITLMIE